MDIAPSMITQLIESLQAATQSLPPHVQWLAVLAAGALPFIESYYGSVIGIVAGIPPAIAIPAAIIGNITSTTATIAATARFTPPRPHAPVEPELKNRRLRRLFDRYGLPGISMLGQTVLPNQITSAMFIRAGLPPRRVWRWQVLSIITWGIGYGTLATLGANLLR